MKSNETIMQFFQWYLPEDMQFWNRCVTKAKVLAEAGITAVWLPPAYKGANGIRSVGYDVYDTYDMGEFDQKGSIATKYGTKEEYLEAVRAFHNNNIMVYADVVLNHMMGADFTEEVSVIEENPSDRNQDIAANRTITAWTGFNFPGRAGKYSSKTWSYTDFSGTDWDQGQQINGIYRFEGKTWNKETDSELGNYDYLMGADLDTDNPDTVAAVTAWGKWYQDQFGFDGFRLDAVKHIGFDFYREWIKVQREYFSAKHNSNDFFAVGEYWSYDINRLTHYLDVVDNSMCLFDVPLHMNLFKAATTGGEFNMAEIFKDTLSELRPDMAVTFVDNHDTQPGQALESFIPEWFKCSAYALILLRGVGIPCVFYGDYYGIEHDNIGPVLGLDRLIMVRKLFAYGELRDYLDHNDIIGFTRAGIAEVPDSGLAVVVSNGKGGAKRMYMGVEFAGETMVDVLNHCSYIDEAVTIDGEGFGDFPVHDGSVSVWVKKEAYLRIVK